MTGAAAEPLDDDEPLAPEPDELLAPDRKRTKRDWEEFKLDGHLVRVREPKGAVLIPVALGMESGNYEAMLSAIKTFIETAFDEPSAEHIQDRIEDDDDDFDYVDDVFPLFEVLSARWANTNHGAASRPTGSSRGSSPRSRRTTRRSTAKSP